MRMTPSQFLKEFTDEAALLEEIKKRAPVSTEDLQPLVKYHKNPEFCENYLWSMLGNLEQFKLIKIRKNIVEIP